MRVSIHSGQGCPLSARGLTGHIDDHFLAPPVPDVPGERAETDDKRPERAAQKPHTEEFDNTVLRCRRPAPPSDKSPKAVLQKNHRHREGGISCSLACGLLLENVTLSPVQAPIPDSV